MSSQTATHQHGINSISTFGFWIFVLSDFILFATLFTSYVVLSPHTYGSIGVRQTAGLNYVFVQALLMLAACLTYGFGIFSMHRNQKGITQFWLLVTFLFGLGFTLMQWHVFSTLYSAGYTWHDSAFLSIFYTLLAAHWFHVIVGLLWTAIIFIQLFLQPLTTTMKTRLTCLGIFWVFLNIIWVVIFTVVYLMGAI